MGVTQGPLRIDSGLWQWPLDFPPDNLLCCPEGPGSARTGYATHARPV